MWFIKQVGRRACTLFIQVTLSYGILLISFYPPSLLANFGCLGWNEEGFFNDLSIIEVVDCVQGGANLEARNSNGLTPLQSVLNLHDQEFVRIAVEILLIAGADPNAAGSNQATPLILSMRYDDADITRMLLSAGADPNLADVAGRTALHAAYSADHVAALLAHGADSNAIDQNGQTVLHAALWQGGGDTIIRMLLEHGADPNVVDQNGQTVLHAALWQGGDDTIIRTLLEHGANPEIPDFYGHSPLILAANLENQAQVEALVEFGADPNAAGEDFWSPLSIAAQTNQDKAVLQLLLSAGAKLQLDGSFSAMATAIAQNRNPEIGAMLLQAHHEDIAGEQSIFWKPGLRRVKCWFNQYEFAGDVECFYMVVHENPDEHSHKYVSFPVVRFFDRNLSTLNSPLIDLGGGGPGGETDIGQGQFPFNSQMLWEDLARPIDRELYVIDVRGTGIAHPKLSCDLNIYRHSFVDVGYLDNWRPLDGLYSDYEICKERLDELGIDLSRYNSRVVARDVEFLRRELGIEKWVLVGYSYSARYAVTVARDFPQTVESMVLVAPGELPGTISQYSPEYYEKGFEKVFTWCEDKLDTCVSDDIDARFQNLVEQLNKDPLIITSISEELSYRYQIDRLVLTGHRLIDWLFFNLYDSAFFDEFPRLMHELERLVSRSEEPVSELLLDSIDVYLEFNIGTSFSYAVYYAHYCSEVWPFVDYAEWTRPKDETPEYIRRYFEDNFTESDFDRDCQIWDVIPSDKKENDYVKTDIPTLFLVGALDPAAPIDDLNNQLPNFSNHEVLVFENSSHWGPVFGNCAKDASAFFIVNNHLEDRHFHCSNHQAESN